MTSAASRCDGEVALEVERPELWWPNGLGEQRLYRVEALGIDVGFRTVELVQNEGAPADALPYAFVVNGRPSTSAAGTGCRSTRSTACRGRRSSRTCSGSRSVRT